MTKGKSNKHNDNGNNFHNDPEIEKVIDIEVKTEQKTLNPDVFPPISSTVKITNPGEELKISSEKIEEAIAENFEPETNNKEEVKVNIINVSEKTDKKDPVKVSIVDLSQKKSDKSKPKKKFYSLIHNPFNSKIDILSVDFDEKKLEKALDSLIFLGGGVIAVTSLTSKAVADLGNFLIKK